MRRSCWLGFGRLLARRWPFLRFADRGDRPRGRPPLALLAPRRDPSWLCFVKMFRRRKLFSPKGYEQAFVRRIAPVRRQKTSRRRPSIQGRARSTPTRSVSEGSAAGSLADASGWYASMSPRSVSSASAGSFHESAADQRSRRPMSSTASPSPRRGEGSGVRGGVRQRRRCRPPHPAFGHPLPGGERGYRRSESARRSA